MQTAIVTGGSGQIGSFLCKDLLDRGLNVISVSKHQSAFFDKFLFSPLDHVGRFSFFKQDIIKDRSEKLSILIDKCKPDFLINCAAASSVNECIQAPFKALETNAMMIGNQLEAIRVLSPRTKYLNIGSAEEFGNLSFEPQNENHPLLPDNPYGMSKAVARFIVNLYRDYYDIYATQCWCYNVESEFRPEGFFFPKIVKFAVQAKKLMNQGKSVVPLQVGDIHQRRDWSHAEDVVDGIWRMLNQKKSIPENYVICSGEPKTVKELIQEVFNQVGIDGYWEMRSDRDLFVSRGKIILESNNLFYRDYEQERNFSMWGDNKNIRNDLGWSPKVNFTFLVSRAIKHHVDNLNA